MTFSACLAPAPEFRSDPSHRCRDPRWHSSQVAQVS